VSLLLVTTLAMPPASSEPAPVSNDGPSRATQGGADVRKVELRAVPLTDKNKPKPVVLTHPNQMALHKAASKVFNVKNIKSTVVKVERPEHEAPGLEDEDASQGGDLDAPSDSDADADADAETDPAPVADADADADAHNVVTPQENTTSQTLNVPAPATSASFNGLDFATWGAGHPPDANGDVGPSYYIQSINTAVGIFDKSTGARVAAFTYDALMRQAPFGNLCDTDNFGDGVVLYDTYEDRWIITDFAFQLDANDNVSPQHVFQCLAVSKSGDPVAGGWNFYSVEAPGGLADYPKFGVWPDGIYMSANMFGYPSGAPYSGYHVWAFNKQQMYAGAPAVDVIDFAGDTTDFTLLPANSRLQTGTPPAGTPEFFVSTEQFLNALSIYKLHVDWDRISTSTFTGPFTQTQPNCWPNAAPANARTPANSADVLGIRAMAQAQYSKLGGTESLWVSHTVNRGTFATASCGGANTNNATVRWYQADVTGGTVAANIVQGASFDPEAANTFFRYMPALAVDRAGDMAVGYTKSNATTNPQIKYAGRLSGDPLNALAQSEQTLIDGTGSQFGNCGSTCTRWGDYSGMALDPNGCAFWMTGEYYATTDLNFQTRIGSFSYPSCSTVGNGTLSGTVTDGVNPVAGATVRLGSRTTSTDAGGHYSFSVAAGTYPSLTGAKAGFDSSSATTLAVPNGATLTVNLTLTPAAQSGCITDDTQVAFQRGIPSSCDLVASPGHLVLAQPDNTEARNGTVGPSGFGFTNTAWAGQTFTPTVNGLLKRVDVELFCSGCSGADPNITVSIRATTGATPVPTGPDLASATLAGFNNGGTAQLRAVTFSTPITVSAGTRYAFIFRSTAARTGTYAYTCSCTTTGFANSNPYTAGQRVTSTNSGGSWTADATVGGRDLNFVTYINPGFSSNGAFVSSLKDANPVAGATPTWTTLSFVDSTPAGTNVKFLLAGSNSSEGPWNFVGPDGTPATFFTTSGATLSQFNGLRYLRYKALLSTTDPTTTPSVSQVRVCFSNQGDVASTTLVASPASGTFGATATLSATLTSGATPVAGKSVSFSLNGSSVGAATTNSSGVATLVGATLAGIAVGSYPTAVSASWAGDGSFGPSSGTAQLDVSKASTSVAVSTSASPSVFSQPVNFTATVTSAAGTPAGTVQFKIDGVDFGSAVALNASGKAVSGTTSTLAVGSRSISAVYSGSANFNTGTGALKQSVTKAKVSVTLASTPNPVTNGTSITFTVTVGAKAPATSTPGGKVRLFRNGVQIQTTHKLSAGKSTYTFTWTAGAGTFNMTAKYLGNAKFKAATSAIYSQVVTT